MSTTKKGATKGSKASKKATASKKQSVNRKNTTKGSATNAESIEEQKKSLTSKEVKEQTTPKGVEQTTDNQPSAEQVEKSVKSMNRLIAKCLKLTKGDVLDPVNWLKVFKKNFDKQSLKKIEEQWATIIVAIKMAGDYYLEEITVKDSKTGKKKTVLKAHMVKWQPISKANEIGRAIKPKAYHYGNEEETAIKSVKDLTIEREIVKYKVLKETFNGVEWTRKVAHKVSMKLRPVEILDITYGDFAQRVRTAFAVVFPQGLDF